MNTAVGHDEVQKRTRFINRAEPGELAHRAGRTSLMCWMWWASWWRVAGRTSTGRTSRGWGWGRPRRGSRCGRRCGSRTRMGILGFPRSAIAYNPDGLLVETRDALGSRRELGYDAVTRTFVTRESVWTESGELKVTASYDTGLGAVVTSQDFNGHTSQFHLRRPGTAHCHHRAPRHNRKTAAEVRLRIWDAAVPSLARHRPTLWWTARPPGTTGTRGAGPTPMDWGEVG